MSEHPVLVIGCGSIGERHLRSFQRTGRAKPTACDTSPELLATMARTYQVPTVSDWRQAITTGRFEAVVVCTPAHLHIPMAIHSLQSALHVLIEKPLSQSLAGIAELEGAYKRSGRQIAVGYILHVYPLLIQVRDYLRSGELGAVKHVTVTSGQHFPGGRPAHAVHYSKTYYRDRKTGGGAIQDALTHTANWMESLLGPTDCVLCDCAHQVLEGVTVEDTVNLSARHGGVLVNYTLNQFQAPNESTYQFNTAAGSVKVELHQQRWGVLRLGDKDWTWNTVPRMGRDTPFIKQADLFLDQIEGQASSLCTLEAAIHTLRFNLAALASADSGTRIHCQQIPA